MQGRCNGNGGESVTIMVSDSCPECEADHLDLQALTYNQVQPQIDPLAPGIGPNQNDCVNRKLFHNVLTVLPLVCVVRIDKCIMIHDKLSRISTCCDLLRLMEWD